MAPFKPSILINKSSMKLNKKLFACIVSYCCFNVLSAQLKLPKLISDSMVLQRDTPLKIWGWASFGDTVSILFNHKTYTALTHEDGKWQANITPTKAGGPYTMEIKSGKQHITVHDILLGDVWVCSGQSNMELPVERVKEKYADEFEHINNPFIRQFNIDKTFSFQKNEEDYTHAKWETANIKSIDNFTAVGYFFAKELYLKHKVPIAIIKCAVGGSPAEAWLSEDALQQFPSYFNTAQKFKSAAFVDSIKNADNAINYSWYQNIYTQDKGLQENTKWFDARYDASAWPTMQIPDYWDNQGLKNTNGVVWFKKEIDIPDSLAGKAARILLGTIIDRDSVYLNGVFIGTTGYQYPPRKYNIPQNIIKKGKNILTVRVINYWGRGGFLKDKPYQLVIDHNVIDLKGNWQYQVGVATKPISPTTTFSYQPGSLFKAMLAPLFNCSIKGVIWYQGESNTSKAKEYQALFPALINDWRMHWNEGNFPFLYVQLSNYMPAKNYPDESQWAELREAQLKTLSVPNTAMAVISNIGEWNDIHPLNKKDVGIRLALGAEKVAYHNTKIVSSGPLYTSMKIEGNKIVISFSNIGKGLMIKGKELKYFSIAGLDKKFVWANAIIKNNRVIVSNDAIKNPVAVRYAWSDNPEGANLYNKEGLPASSFRTDSQ
jgi:sialate O-acetylesterase